ncbi:MAG: hypothetical protein HY588_00325, partial [Candidatus Omnitrophica bacterium]|nr:hypothetical protein [Candidatus Omnitrophota bacterium]
MLKRSRRMTAFLTAFLFVFSQIAWPEPSVPIDFNKTVQPVSEALQAESAESQEPTPKTSIDFLANTSPLSAAAAEENKEQPVILFAAQDEPALQIIRTKTATNRSGQVTGFSEEIRDSEGNLLYTLTRSSIRYDKQGSLISYKDTFKFPDKTVLTGTYQNDTYLLKGTWRSSPNGSQAIERRFDLNAGQRLLIDPDRKETSLINDTLWTGFGESTVLGDFEVIRYKETQDKSGRTTSYEEHVFDPATGELLYTLKRTSIRYDRNTGELISYKDTFTFPDKTSLVGTFKEGAYILKGTWRSSPNGNQGIEHHFNLTQDQRLLIDPNRKTSAFIGDTLFTGFGESTIMGDFEVIRYKETQDREGRATGFEEHVFKDGLYLYQLTHSSVKYDKVTGEMIFYKDTVAFQNKKKLTMTFDAKKSMILNGNLPDGFSFRNLLIHEVQSQYRVFYNEQDGLFYAHGLD